MLNPKDVNCVIAHGNCPDGFGAAWTAHTMHGDNIEYHFISYNKDGMVIPDVKGKNVLMVDFAYPDPEIMNALNRDANSMLLLDHHKSAKENLEGKIDCDHIFDMNRSGARMAWDFFYPEKEVSLLIRYIEDRDIWKWKIPQAKPYLASLDSYPQTYETYDWINSLTFSMSKISQKPSDIESFISEGKSILRYHDVLVMDMVKRAAFGYLKTPNGGRHACFAVNSSSRQLVSDIGNKLAHDNIVGFIYGHSTFSEKYFASLRSVGNVDVSVMAKEFGGGGHKNASGFDFRGQISDVFENEKSEFVCEKMKNRLLETL